MYITEKVLISLTYKKHIKIEEKSYLKMDMKHIQFTYTYTCYITLNYVGMYNFMHNK